MGLLLMLPFILVFTYWVICLIVKALKGYRHEQEVLMVLFFTFSLVLFVIGLGSFLK